MTQGEGRSASCQLALGKLRKRAVLTSKRPTDQGNFGPCVTIRDSDVTQPALRNWSSALSWFTHVTVTGDSVYLPPLAGTAAYHSHGIILVFGHLLHLFSRPTARKLVTNSAGLAGEKNCQKPLFSVSLH